MKTKEQRTKLEAKSLKCYRGVAGRFRHEGQHYILMAADETSLEAGARTLLGDKGFVLDATKVDASIIISAKVLKGE